MAIAIELTFGLAAALSQGASAASDKRHAAKTHPAKQPAEQYLRSAAPPDPEHQQR